MSKRKEHKYVSGIECKECSCCRKWLPVDSFQKDNSKWDGLYGFCKECKKIKDSKIYYANPKKKYEKVLEYQRRTGLISKYRPYNPAYYSSEKSRKKKRARDLNRRCLKRKAEEQNRITPEVINAVIEKYDGKCAYCGTDCTKYYEIDHKLPLVRGGGNDIDNLALSCKHCNRSKKDKTDVEFCGHSV